MRGIDKVRSAEDVRKDPGYEVGRAMDGGTFYKHITRVPAR
jgi:hypothetical protein